MEEWEYTINSYAINIDIEITFLKNHKQLSEMDIESNKKCAYLD
jgi:hypothetical protein